MPRPRSPVNAPRPARPSITRLRSSALGLVLVTLLGLASCGDSDDPANSDATEGGRGPGSGGKPGGSGRPGDGGEPNDPDARFDSIWRYARGEITYIDTANPTAFEPAPFEFPDTFEVPGQERPLELYLQLTGETLVTYAYYENEAAYYRILQHASMADDSYFVSLGATVQLYTLKNGKLIQTTQGGHDTALILAETTLERYDGTFPPSHWPSEVVTFDVRELP